MPIEIEQGEIRRITWIGLFGNLFITALKFIVGIVGSSQAIVADALHSLSDSTTDIAVLVGVKFWSAPPDENHPYGHRRIEAIVTAIIGIVLALVAIGIGYKAIATVRQEHIEQPQRIALIGALASIVIKEILYRWTIAVGRRVKSSAVIANAWHHRSDAFSSIPAALAVIVAVSNPRWSFVDDIGALIVSFFILHAAWRIIGPVFNELSDAGASQQTCNRIKEVAGEIDELQSAHAIRTRKMGSSVLVDLHITVDGDMTVSRGHEISENVKRRIMDAIPEIADVVVHLEPSNDPVSYDD